MSESIKNLGYSFASNRDAGRKIAREVYGQFPNFHESVDDEVKDELYSAFALRYQENNPNADATYLLKDKQYILMPEGHKVTKSDITFHLTVSTAMAESAQKFGSMRTSNPALHALIKPLRDAVSKYQSNTLKALQRAVREIANEGVERSRGATKSFDDKVKSTLFDWKKAVKSAKARGDETANEKLLADATLAFLAIWNNA